MTTKIAKRLNLILFISYLFLNLMVRFNPPVWVGFGDPYDYLHQSNASLLSKDLYCPEKSTHFYPRPFTVPLFYKIASSEPDNIIQLQKIVHSISSFFICYVFLFYFKKPSTKIIFTIFWYLLMSWWNIFGWTQTLLSESLSTSLLFCWLASFILFYQKKNKSTFILHCILTILFSFTRDSWPYVLIAFYAMVALYVFIWDTTIRKEIISLIILSLCIFIIQQKSAEIGQRYRLPILNNIVFRILPNKDYYNWYINKVMPCSKELKHQYSNLSNWQMIYPLYEDTNYKKLSDWAIKEGKSTYTKFLITHPSYVFLQNEKKEDLNRIFAYNIGYIGNVCGSSYLSEYMFPLFNTISILLLDAIVVFFFIRRRSFELLLPSILILLFALNAYLLYIADSLEVERHLFITNIMIQFIGIYLFSLVVDMIDFKTIKGKFKK